MTYDPDHPVNRRRALAAMTAHLAGYTTERLDALRRGADDLGVPMPPELATFPRVLATWADTIERTQP